MRSLITAYKNFSSASVLRLQRIKILFSGAVLHSGVLTEGECCADKSIKISSTATNIRD